LCNKETLRLYISLGFFMDQHYIDVPNRGDQCASCSLAYGASH
jgi:hypothetical protein